MNEIAIAFKGRDFKGNKREIQKDDHSLRTVIRESVRGGIRESFGVHFFSECSDRYKNWHIYYREIKQNLEKSNFRKFKSIVLRAPRTDFDNCWCKNVALLLYFTRTNFYGVPRTL